MKEASGFHSLGIPTKFWSKVSTDFVTKFPKGRRGDDAALVIVGRLSKKTVFIPTTEAIDAKEVAFFLECNLFPSTAFLLRLNSIAIQSSPQTLTGIWPK